MMQYLGGISGQGTLCSGGTDIAPATYDFDGYFQQRVGLSSNGEIRLNCACLQAIFGRTDVQLRTGDGRLLELRFSDKQAVSANGVAHVDVTGDLASHFARAAELAHA